MGLGNKYYFFVFLIINSVVQIIVLNFLYFREYIFNNINTLIHKYINTLLVIFHELIYFRTHDTVMYKYNKIIFY